MDIKGPNVATDFMSQTGAQDDFFIIFHKGEQYPDIKGSW